MNRYRQLITKVAEEVAREFAAPSGSNGHGYRVADADDIEQRVYLKLIEGGYDDTYFDGLDNPQASLRLFARNAARREAETRHRRHDGSGKGYREQPMDFTEQPDDTPSPGAAIARTTASTLGRPLTETLSAELESRLLAVAEDLLSKVTPRRAEALALWALDGLDARAISNRLGTSYGYIRNLLSEAQKALHPDEAASLRALRAYWHPEAKAPKAATGQATALLDLLTT